MATAVISTDNASDSKDIELWKIRKLIRTLESYKG